MYQELDNYIGESMNYRTLTKVLNLPYASGASKMAQIKLINKYYRMKKEGIKYKIIGRMPNPPLWYYTKSDMNKCGVYAIKSLENRIYIGSTTVSFRLRYHAHKAKDNKSSSKEIIHEPHIFEILWVADDSTIEKDLREKEQEYINLYSNDPRWDVVNSNMSVGRRARKPIYVLEDNYDEIVALLKERNLI